MSESERTERPLFGKIIFRGIIEAKTGLHIGGAREPLEIGGIDLPVIREPIERYPYIPGSSLKGKMRSLFERHVMTKLKGTGNISDFLQEVGQVKIHVCSNPDCVICRLYGSSTRDSNLPARIIIRDSYLTLESKELLKDVESPLLYTELKYENTIDRITSAAMPRQIERVPAGTEFNFEAIYNVDDLEELKEDIENFLLSMALLEDDYLGGHGSRGYGKIEFKLSLIEAKKVEAYSGKTNGTVKVIEENVVKNWRENISKIAEMIASFFKGGE